MKPDFSQMSRKELRTYLLNHRNDEATFFAFVASFAARSVRSETEANWTEFPAIESVEDLKNFPDFLQRINKETQSDS